MIIAGMFFVFIILAGATEDLLKEMRRDRLEAIDTAHWMQ